MSTPRRMFEDPRNTYIVRNDDPDAFDKRFVGRPGVHREQQCCRNRSPVWQTYLLHDDRDADDDNPRAYKESVGLQVEDATGASDNATGRNQLKGYVWVEGPTSGYKPGFISPDEWMRWQGVRRVPSPTPVPGVSANPPRWVRTADGAKVRWGDQGDWEFLWCQTCDLPLESAWADILDVLPAAARGIAMVVSWVPVFGTALSLVISSAVSLAEGEPIGKALLDAIGDALPGQPASRIGFHAAVAIASGERLEEAFIEALEVDESVKEVLRVADAVVVRIANGESVTDVAYGTVRDRLPPEAQRGMEYARRVVDGESVSEMVLTEAEQEVVDRVSIAARAALDAAQSQGADAMAAAQQLASSYYNQYAAEVGYQMALDALPAQARGALQLGVAGGAALRPQAPPLGWYAPVAETDVASNDGHRDKGDQLIASGIRYRGAPVSAIVAGPQVTIVIDYYDLLNEVWTKRPTTYTVTDTWRRGFAIAIAVCDGSSQQGPRQLAVYHTMAETGGRDGFLAGQAVQFDRTLHGDSGLTDTAVAKADTTLHGVRAVAPDFVGLSPDAALRLASSEGVTVDFLHAQSADDEFGEDLQTLLSDPDSGRTHTDAEIVVTVQRPVAGSPLVIGARVSLGVALAAGVT